MAKRAETQESNWGKVVNEGMGGFLNPPTHPGHYKSVSSVYGHTFSMTLSSAAKEEWLDDETRNEARRILDEWKAPDINSNEVQEWILEVLGYFRNCYQGKNGSWKASDLRIISDKTLLPVEKHAGVHHIREYYPDFEPTESHFQEAYWGKKPE